MKQSIFIFFSLFLPILLNAQVNERGAAPIVESNNKTGTTRAVIIGVSEYEDEGIPTLQYAHVDAEEFAKFLKTKAGGSLTSDQVSIITNDKATVANIYSQLDWLLEETKENDKVIFYFSGHGDVETRTSRNKGFLLAHDTPSHNYFVGGLRVNELNDILSDLATVNKAQVILIADACRSGELAGGIDGTTATASALSESFNNQVKIMSCHPNELSREGDQWGGGRGVFSFHLIDGLMGLADEDGDEKVDLDELDDYLDDRVPKETEKRQYPMLVGSPRTVLANIDAEELAALVKLKSGQPEIIAAVASRGNIQDILAQSDTSIQRVYQEFNTALENQYFLPEDYNSSREKGKSASELFDILSGEKSIEQLHADLRRNFAVALQDKSQKSINAYLKSDPEEMKERWDNYGKNYKSNPAYLSKAATLLEKDHYLYNSLLAKKYYYEGLMLRLEGEKTQNELLFYLALEKINTAVNLDGEAAYIYNEIGLIKKELYKFKKAKNEAAEIINTLYNEQIDNFKKASSFAPKWIMPYLNSAIIHWLHGNNNKAEEACEQASIIDPSQIGLLWVRANLMHEKENFNEAITLFNQVIELNPNFNAELYNNLGWAYQQTEQHDLAEKMYLKSVSLKPSFPLPYENLGFLYYVNKDYNKCIEINKKWIAISPEDKMAYYNIACLYSIKNETLESVKWLEKAIEKGYNDFEKIKSDGDLENTRKTAAYKAFAEKYLISN